MLHCFCIVCDKNLERDGGSRNDISNPPSDGIYLTSYGNYGSTVFDPMAENERLEMYICDECLKVKAHRIHLVKSRKRVILEVFPFEPNKETQK